MQTLNGLLHFLRKYRIAHIAFWAWAFMNTWHLRVEFHPGTSYRQQLSNTIAHIGFEMISVYGIIFFLIPRLLNRNRVALFFLASVAFIALSSFMRVMVHKLYLVIFTDYVFVYSNITMYTIVEFMDQILVVAIFVSLYIITALYRKDQVNKRLEKEKLEAELNFLKSQTSPHFVFNVLNSIYVLIDFDKKQARDVLIKFSGLLRYQLYECSNEKVFLSKELEFLEHYIGLEKIRNKNMVVQYHKPDPMPNFQLAPFLLIPLVENAFKHISRYKDQQNTIIIHIQATEESFSADITNTYEAQVVNQEKAGGIGLQNVSKRLQLLYPGKHQLDVIREHGLFKVNLKLYADKNELHHH